MGAVRAVAEFGVECICWLDRHVVAWRVCYENGSLIVILFRVQFSVSVPGGCSEVRAWTVCDGVVSWSGVDLVVIVFSIRVRERGFSRDWRDCRSER